MGSWCGNRSDSDSNSGDGHSVSLRWETSGPEAQSETANQSSDALEDPKHFQMAVAFCPRAPASRTDSDDH